MKQRLSSPERREQLVGVMHHLYQLAQQQADFTAARVAQQAGVSVVLLYRLAGPEFKALRAQLPGPRRLRDEELRHLRQENTELRKQVWEAQEKLRTAAVSELTEAMLLMERYEQENLQLRDEIKLLRQRLKEGGQVIVTLPARKAP